jgi:hypothetical protein
MDIFEIGKAARTAEVNGIAVRSVSLHVKSKIESIISKPDKKTTRDCTDVRWIALRYGVIDKDTNECVFNDGDRGRFSELESWFVEPIFEKILELSGVTGADREAFEGN